MAAAILLVLIIIYFMLRWPTEARERIGCFTFNHDNTVLTARTQDPVGSIDACLQQCLTRSATYAGVRNGFQCYCGDNHNHTVNGEQLSDSSCATTCNNHGSGCGGQFSIVIYSVCSRGRYHDNTNDEPQCDASCNCEDNDICLYNTGSCPANCETGWSGEACDVRVAHSTTYATTLKRMLNVTYSTNNGVTVSPNTTMLTDEGAKVTAVAGGVSSAVLALIVIIALIVFFRRRRDPHNSVIEYDRGMTILDVNTDDSTAKQKEYGLTVNTATESTEPCYSSVDFLNNGPAHINSEDIPKSDDDVAIDGKLEIVEYAVVKKPGDEKHMNLKENSLYGTNAGNSDEEGQE